MPQIVVKNSFTELVGFSHQTLALVQKELTYTDEQVLLEIKNLKFRLQVAIYQRNKRLAWFFKKKIGELENSVKVCLLKGNKFPTGLLGHVEDVVKESYALKDLRIRPESGLFLPWKPLNYEPRYYQLEMVKRGIEAGRGVFESAVGSGKTLVLQMLIKELDVPTLIISPSTDLKEQTYGNLIEVFGIKYVDKISSNSLKKKLKPIRIVNIQTLAALQKKGKLAPVLEGIDMVCIDEFHHVGAASYTKLLPELENIYYRFGFTGTFLRNDSKTLDMYGVLSSVLYKYPASTAIKEGYLTPLAVKVHDISGKKGANYNVEYKRNYCGSDVFLSKILEILEDYVEKDQQVLILVKQKDASGKIIHGFLEELGYPNEYISGDDKKDRIKKVLQDFNDKKVNILIGSTIIGEGIDIRSTNHLIMAQGGKSEIAVTQATGRAVRLHPGKKVAILHDFNFQNTKYLQNHLLQRIKTYEKNFNADIEVVEDECS